MAGCGCRAPTGASTYGSVDPVEQVVAAHPGATLDAQEMDLVAAIRDARQAGDRDRVARLSGDLEHVREALTDARIAALARRGAAERRAVRGSTGRHASGSAAPSSIFRPFTGVSDEALALVPETRATPSGDLRLDASHRPTVVPRAGVSTSADPDLEARLAAFSWAPRQPRTLAEQIAQTEAEVRRDFEAWNRHQYPGLARIYAERFASFLPGYRALGQAMGRAGKQNRLSQDAQVRLTDEKAIAAFGLGNTRPAWYLTLSGRLLPLYAQAGATTSGFSGTSSSGYLRSGYGR